VGLNCHIGVFFGKDVLGVTKLFLLEVNSIKKKLDKPTDVGYIVSALSF